MGSNVTSVFRDFQWKSLPIKLSHLLKALLIWEEFFSLLKSDTFISKKTIPPMPLHKPRPGFQINPGIISAESFVFRTRATSKMYGFARAAKTAHDTEFFSNQKPLVGDRDESSSSFLPFQIDTATQQLPRSTDGEKSISTFSFFSFPPPTISIYSPSLCSDIIEFSTKS